MLIRPWYARSRAGASQQTLQVLLCFKSRAGASQQTFANVVEVRRFSGPFHGSPRVSTILHEARRVSTVEVRSEPVHRILKSLELARPVNLINRSLSL